MTSGIYQIQNTQTAQVYVGSAVSLSARWSQHRSGLRKNVHFNKRLQNSWNKYGERAFVFSVLEHVEDVTRLIEREQHHIDVLKAYYKVGNGFNLSPTAGSRLGCTQPAQVFSEERRAKISKALTGLKRSPETLLKMSLASKAQFQKMNPWNKGKPPDAATRAKISAAQKGQESYERTAEHRAKQSAILKEAWAKKPQRPEVRVCGNCGRDYKRGRMNRCNACYVFRSRNNMERPLT